MSEAASSENDVGLIDDNWEPSREQLVFLIDCHPKMFEPLTGEEGIQASSLFELSIRVSIDVLRGRIIESENDEICVIFYGTRSTQSGDDHENVCVYLDLDYTDVSRIKKLGALSDAKFLEEIGNSVDEDFSPGTALCNGLSTAMSLLQDNLKAAKSILLFTSNPNPCVSSGQIRSQALDQATQLQNSHIFLRVFLLPYGSHTPEIEFWRSMNERTKAVDDPDDFDDDVLARLENLFDGVRKKMFLKHPLARLKLTIFKDLELDVQLYALIRPATKGRGTKLDSRTNEEIERSTVFISKDTGEPIEPEDLDLHVFSPKHRDPEHPYPEIIVNRSEVKELKTSCAPGITILGFKSLHCLKPYHQLAPPHFVYPDERCFAQNIGAFIALHECMLKTNTFAVCRYCTSRSPEVRLGALVSQEEKNDDNGHQLDPPGFHLIQLPYIDDIRPPQQDNEVMTDSVQGSEEEMKATRDLIRSLTLSEDYSSLDITNPQLQRHFSIVEALALNEAIPNVDDAEDDTKPDQKMFESNSSIIEAFKSCIIDSAEADEESARKKRRIEVMSEDEMSFVQSTNWLELSQEDQLHTLTVLQLKLYLKSKGLTLSGKKDILIERIRQDLTAWAP